MKFKTTHQTTAPYFNPYSDGTCLNKRILSKRTQRAGFTFVI